jgi:hypothetical protein
MNRVEVHVSPRTRNRVPWQVLLSGPPLQLLLLGLKERLPVRLSLCGIDVHLTYSAT